MLVRINDAYRGTYGHYDRELNTVTPKRAGDPPFEVDAGVAERHIKNGVLLAVSARKEEKADAVGETQPPVQTPSPEVIREVTEETDIDSMSFAELKKAAKDRGINCFGKKTEALRALIKEYDAMKAPSFTAEDPV